MGEHTNPVEVRAALARVLASDGFRSSPRLSRFLEHLVEASLSGSQQSLKEYSIGIDVFQKPPSFDARSDSTVRSEASKLRLKLRLYYETAGAEDPIVIELPKGGYAATFRARRNQKDRKRSLVAWAALLTLTIGLLWLLRHDTRTLPNLTRITNDVGLTTYPAVSQRGEMLAYASDRGGRGDLDIWIQPLAGGNAHRLTDHEADEYDPHFSPDGTSIAFRSDIDGGGIYILPSTGGQPRLIASGGHHPRFSPDGKWLAYSAGATRLHPTTPGSSHMFIVPAGGGTPQQVQPRFSSAFHPVWAPDGKHLLFLGVSDGARAREELDWWVTPLEGGAAVRTGAHAMFSKLRLLPPEWPRIPLTPTHWSNEYVLFSRQSKDSVNVWKAPISLRTFRIGDRPERLTFGSGSEVSAIRTETNAFVIADVRVNFEIWSLPIDANRGRTTGPPQRITHNTALDDWPSVSRDGKKLLYLSYRTGASEIWLKDFATDRENPVTADRTPKNWPEIAPDGKSYYFTRTERPAAIWWAKLGNAPQQLCVDCQTLTPLSDGGFLHSNLSPPAHPHLMDAAGRSRPWLQHPAAWNLHQPQPSPDGKWVTFYASLSPQRTRIYVARFRRDSPPRPEEWITVTGDEFLETAPLWSPDGNRLYFGSNRDDFQCIWSVPLHPDSKRPSGPPEAVVHFHRASLAMGNVGLTRRGMSVAIDKIVFTLTERSGNLWLLRSR